MSRKKKIIIIFCCLSLGCLLSVIPIINRVFILAVKYNVDGQSVDCTQEGTIDLDGFDGVKSCWGYGINMQDEKIYIGIDFGGLEYYGLRDRCDVNGDQISIDYYLEFPQKKVHRFWKETVFLDFERDAAGNIRGTVNTAHHTHGSDSELLLFDEINLGDRVLYFDCPQMGVRLRF